MGLYHDNHEDIDDTLNLNDENYYRRDDNRNIYVW